MEHLDWKAGNMAPTCRGLANFTDFPAPGVAVGALSVSDIFTKSLQLWVRITSFKFSKMFYLI